MHSLSYIVVSYNSAETIVACLKALSSAAADRSAGELIVVDNASDDETVGIVTAQFPAVKVRQMDHNVGFAVAANSGSRHARGEYLCFINPDAVVDPDFGKELAVILSSSLPVDIAGGTYHSRDGTRLPSSWRPPGLCTITVESFLPYAVANRLTTSEPSGNGDVDMVSGGCLLIRKRVFDQLNGFDERFFLYYEDADLCRRAGSSGYGIRQYPALRAYHEGRESFRGDFTEFYYRYFQSKLLYCEKHFSPLKNRIARSMILAGIILRRYAYDLTGVLTGKGEFRRLSAQHREALKRIKTGDSTV